MSWPTLIVFRELSRPAPSYVLVWLLGILICLVGPAAWPLGLRALQRWGARKGLLLGSNQFAWDFYFSRREPCWVIVHLNGGELVGGYMGLSSYATVAPQSGHIYLEEVWQLSPEGEFLAPFPSTRGALFRPGDYHRIELKADKETP